MSRLSLYLLGSPRIELGGLPVRVDTRKAIALLAYIAITGESHQRDALVNLLWPESDQTRGRATLRRNLYALRKALTEDYFDVDRETVGLNADCDIWLDVDQFHSHLNECLTHGHPASEACLDCVPPLTAAVELYRGDFLAGFSLKDSYDFDEWQFFQADALRREVSSALDRLVQCYTAQGAFERATDFARQWLALDRLNEDAHCQLMLLYAWSDQRSAALRQYQESVRILEDELGAPPQEETTALYQAILAGRVPGPPVDMGQRPVAGRGEEFEKVLTIGSTLQDRYRLDAELGSGSVGVVYRARDTLLERDVAVKVLSAAILDTEGRARLLQEARAAARLNHPNIVTVYDVGGIDQGSPSTLPATLGQAVAFIVMELVEGVSLHSRRPESLEEALSIARQVCAALEHAHSHGIIHCDLKPENVLLTAEGTAKLSDLGLARAVASRQTKEGAIAGTVFYLAPEQALGQELDGRADLYALGVMLYELTAGQLPFVGEDPLAVIAQHLHAPVVPPSVHNAGILPALDALIAQLLSKQPADRPASAAEVLTALNHLGRPDVQAVVEVAGVPSQLLGVREREPAEVGRDVFVARERELGRLSSYLDAALAGRGRMVFVIGGAGRGKTALIQEFARRAQQRVVDLVCSIGNCNAHTGFGDPYLPFREVLGLLTGDVDALWQAGAINREHARGLWDSFPVVVQALVDVGPDLIDTFLPGSALIRRATAYLAGGISGRPAWLVRLQELVERKAAVPHDPNLQQSALFEQYARVIRALARERPVLLALDDLQWADLGSVGLLFHLGRGLGSSRVLIVGAYRPEEVAFGRPLTLRQAQGRPGVQERERHPLESVIHEFQRGFGDITIDLAQAEDRLFVEEYLDAEPNRLSGAFRETLYCQTQGHPLFTVELLHRMQERGDLIRDDAGRWVEGPALDWETLPTRTEAVIAERIGRLAPSSLDVLRVASVEGEIFTAEVVARVQSADELEIIERLSRDLDRRHRLVRAQEMQRLGARRLSRYRFRHILYQSYLYHNLDPVERAHLHEAVGVTLEALYGEETDEIAVPLARHFQEAGIAEKAVAYLLKAGENAKRSSANEEAIGHLTKGMELLYTLPETPERVQRELDLQIALGVPVTATKGYGSEEAESIYNRSRELCQQVGETSQLFPSLYGLWRFYLIRSRQQTSRELGEQLMHLAQSAQDPGLLLEAHRALGCSLFHVGEVERALTHFQQGVTLYDRQQYHTHPFLYGHDPAVSCLTYAAMGLWQLGCPDQALQRYKQGLSLARELSHPFSEGYSLSVSTLVLQFLRDAKAVEERAEAALALSSEHGFPFLIAVGILLRGWALAEQGELEEGIAELRRGLAAYQATGTEAFLPYYLSLLAEAFGKADRPEEGLGLAAQALTVVEETGENVFEAEVHRLMGELLLTRTREDEAETCFQRALEVARRQSAKSWELRAAMSLSRVWNKQGKTADAHALLQEVYGWFTEGFDTADLKEARALLDELG